MDEMLTELRRIKKYSEDQDELMYTIQMIAEIMEGMKEGSE